jgi:hypothetical protein
MDAVFEAAPGEQTPSRANKGQLGRSLSRNVGACSKVEEF